MLWRAYKMAFWVTYDHLGHWVLLNLLCAMTLAFPFVLMGFVPAPPGIPYGFIFYAAFPYYVIFGVVLPNLAAALAWVAKEYIETRDSSPLAFREGLRRFGWSSARLGMLYATAVAALGANMVYYFLDLAVSAPLLGSLLGAMSGWALLFVLLTAPLAVCALVNRPGGAWAAARLATLLVLGNPLYAAGLGLGVLGWMLLALFPPAFLLCSFAPAMVLAASGYEMLSRKYDAAREGRPLVWNDAGDDYLNRGLRDFLFPWRM